MKKLYLLVLFVLMIFLFPQNGNSSQLGSWKIDDFVTFTVNTHIPSTGVATDSTGSPAYRIYEDETSTAIVTGSMAKLDDTNTTGFYSERVQLTSGSGFEKGKSYSIYISATVGSATGTLSHTFQIEAEVDTNTNSDKNSYNLASDQSGVTIGTANVVAGVVDSNIVSVQSDGQSATDFKDLVDTGYDPVLNVVDSNAKYISYDQDAANNLEAWFDGSGYTATNSKIGSALNMRGTDNAFLAASAPTNFSLLDINGTGQVDIYQIENVDATNAIRDSILSDSTLFSGTLISAINLKTTNLPTDPASERAIMHRIDAREGNHIRCGVTYYVDSVLGSDTGGDGSRTSPWQTISKAHTDGVISGNGDIIFLTGNETSGISSINEQVTISKNKVTLTGTGESYLIYTNSAGDLVTVSGVNCEIINLRLRTHSTGGGNAITVNGDGTKISNVFVESSQGDGVEVNNASRTTITNNTIFSTGQSAGSGISIVGTSSATEWTNIRDNRVQHSGGDGINLTGGNVSHSQIFENDFAHNGGWGVNVGGAVGETFIIENHFSNNTSGDINDAGTETHSMNNEQWATATSLSIVDTVVDSVLTDTNEIQGKLPTNNIMGSSDATDKDDEIDSIKIKVDAIQP
jgi:hypothetical protein